jgi:heterodisulfide reductase subunit A-like polyferredoxin
MNRLFLISVAAALAGCATAPVNTLASVETADSAALAAVIVYERTPAAVTPAGVALLAKLRADQLRVDAVLLPLETAEANGTSVVTAAQVEAVSAVLAVLTADETAAGIVTSTKGA